MIIKSKRFVLRPCRKEDGKSLIENINDKTIYKNTSTIPYPYTKKDFRGWIKKNEKLKKEKKKTVVHFTIDVNGEAIGGVGIDHIDGYKGEVGYWIGSRFRNKGIITEAVKLVTNFGFKKLKLTRIYARIFSKNTASIKVMEKNGYKFEGRMIKAFLKDKKFMDVLMYAKIK